MGGTNSRRRTTRPKFPSAKGLQRRLIDLCVVVAIYLVVRAIIHIGSSRPTRAGRRHSRVRHNLSSCERIGRADDETPISAHHVYSPNGLLQVNPDGIHPILALIRSAEDEWDRKLDRASRTLEEAVKEYKRRYRRDPPVGFDDWWDFAQEMEAQLPDEYDMIHRQLEPFWGMDPKDLANVQAAHEMRIDTFTILKNATHDTHLITTSFSDPEKWEQNNLLRGLEEVINLLDPIEPALRPFRAVFSPHPEPSLLSDYHIKKALLDAAAARQYVNITNLPTPYDLGFASACPQGSPGRPAEQVGPSIHRLDPLSERTFIHNPRSSMDPCQNPHLFSRHGHYISKHASPQPILAAQFSYSTTPLYHDIQLPSFFGWQADGLAFEDDPEWENKTDERLLWRGSNVGIVNNEETPWRDAHRSRLVSWANDLNGTSNVLIPGRIDDEGWQRVGGGTTVKKALINPALLDVAFVGKPLGCNVQFCRFMETEFEWRKYREFHEKEAVQHKFILDVDGKGPSTEFKKLMTSNSLVFKATAYPEWWLERSQPWVHYVPIQVDYSDIYDILLFFRGDMYGEDGHDQLAKRIAYAGKEWSKTFWREEDMTVYLFSIVNMERRLLLEYSRVTSPDRDSMSYKLKPD
ncbi:hypothetical protein DXG01_007791 [Tephrocybe rancida]|nr:hypothetical protein DXG01_007791 [Tephrocybe rancida]